MSKQQFIDKINAALHPLARNHYKWEGWPGTNAFALAAWDAVEAPLVKQTIQQQALVIAAQKVLDEFGTSSDGLKELYQALKPYATIPQPIGGYVSPDHFDRAFPIYQEPVAQRELIKELADQYATEYVEFAKAIPNSAHSMSPIAAKAEDARLALHAAIDAITSHPLQQPAPSKLCKYGNEPTSCTSSPMDCQCAIDAALDQSAQQEPAATRPCRSCDGSGERFTGIAESPTAICKPCEGTGQIATTSSPQRQPLTEMYIMAIAYACRNNDQIGYVLEIARAIEAAHGITKGEA